MLLRVGQHRLHYDLIGAEGAPVVSFVHALLADSGLWAEQVPAVLKAGYRALCIDIRGHGGSDAVGGDYTMDALASDLTALLDHLRIERVHLVGTSIGGMISQAFAIRNGTRLASLFISDTLPAAPPGDPWGARHEAVRKTNSVAMLVDATIERWFTDSMKQLRPSRWQQIFETMHATSAEGCAGCIGAIRSFDFTPNLPSVRVPTIVVCGADDQGAPPAANRRIASLIPGAIYEEISGSRHTPNVEFPEIYNKLLLSFLDRHRK